MKQKVSILIILFALSGLIARAQTQVLRQKHFNIEKNLAIEGYDPVSYFAGKPKEGKKEFVFVYEGIAYHFVNQVNMESFKANPQKYEPTYGGWCAYAMGARGEKVEVDPETFKIIDGKLYLFYNKFFTNTLTDWNKEETSLKKKADTNWMGLYK